MAGREGKDTSSSDHSEPHQPGLTAAEQQHKAESSHGRDVSQDFWLILTQNTLETHQILWAAMHRGLEFSLSQKHADLFPRKKSELHYISATWCLERTQTLVLTKDLAWDNIKSSLHKQTTS